MKHLIYSLLNEKNIDIKKFNIDDLYKAGMVNVINNIEFYYDKPYTCESVIKELFVSGVVDRIKNK